MQLFDSTTCVKSLQPNKWVDNMHLVDSTAYVKFLQHKQYSYHLYMSPVRFKHDILIE